MLAANFVAGLSIGDFNAAASRFLAAASQRREAITPEQKSAADKEFAAAVAETEVPRQRMTLHFYLGVASSLLAILVNCITVTYFIGTSRWCREVVETYHLPDDYAQRSATLKRRTFPYALLGMFSVLGIVTLGALSDPTIPWRLNDKMWFNVTFPPHTVVNPHYLCAMVGLLVISFAFWIQATRIAANYGIIDEILAQVQRIRGERGMAMKPEEQR